MPQTKAIVLAAGLSRRMNGPNKLLMPHGDDSVIRTVVRALRECPVDVLVVTGRDADLVAEQVAPAATVFNPNFAQGMGTSIAMGVAHQASNAYLIVLGDMPELSASVVRELIRHAQEDRIVVPIYEEEPDRFGHPVLLGGRFANELKALDGDEGARGILRNHPDRIIHVSVPGRLDDRDR